MIKETTAPLDIKFQQRFSKNLVSNIIYFILNIIVGLALVPFFLDSLGNAAYALVPLATSVTSYVTLIVQCLNMSVSRYLTLDLQRGDLVQANVTFNTAMFGTLAVVLALLPVAVAVSFATPYIFSTGGEGASSVTLLFFLVLLSALIRTWTSNFQATVFAHNRLDLWNWVNAVYLLVQVAVVVFLFVVFTPALPLIGVSYVIAAICSGILAAYYSKMTNPSLKLQVSLFSTRLFKDVGKMAGWLVVQQLGSLLLLPVCLIIVNILFGAVAETQFSLAQTFVTLIISISALVTNTFRPMVYSYIARRDNAGAAKFLALTIKITSLVMALPLALICLFSPQLFTLWVGEEYVFLMPLVCVLVLPTIIWIQDACMGPLNVACNKVKVTAIACILSGFVNVILAFTLPFIFDIGMYGVALAWVVALILHGFLFSPIYSAYIIQAPLLSLIKPMGYGICAVIILFISGGIITAIIPGTSLIEAIICGSIFSVIYLVLLMKILLNHREKELILSCIPGFIQKIIPRWLL